MKRILCISVFILIGIAAPVQQARAIGLIAIIKEAIVKAIKAADLAIQRQQNKVIWLQNAQKAAENTMAKLKLDEISDWTEKQRAQYAKYFDELKRVKAIISYYQRIKEITRKQLLLVREFERTWSLIKNDKHFSADEILYMGQVYAGILEQTIRNVDQMMLVVSSFKTQMSDAKRLELLNSAADRVDENYDDLRQFNNENSALSISRARTQQDALNIKKLYGLQ